VIESCIVPCIVTCRPTWEGGQSELSHERRVELLESAATGNARYIDVELETTRHTPSSPMGRALIVSAHVFGGRPERLNNLLLELGRSAAAVIKLVWTARTIRDNLEAFEILQSRAKPTIAFCMGESGIISRILTKKFGGFLSFASLEDGSGTAPGQISIADMKRLYRWDAIGEATRVYGVVGCPVMHSWSPAIHNAAFDAVGFDGIYLPMLVNEGYESFKAFMESFVGFAALDLSGLSVTIPHKENALRYLKEVGGQIEPLAERIGALNTIVVDRAGGACSLRGFSTDYAAILDCITSALGVSRPQISGMRVAVIGAGGTGRTAVAALAHYGATVTIYNRTRGRADALAEEFNRGSGRVSAAGLDQLSNAAFDVLINATSVGMYPKVDAMPLNEPLPPLGPHTLVFDTVYNPAQTKLIGYARSKGAKVVSGVDMFLRQAIGQFDAWTGGPAPADVMRRALDARRARSTS
jgi:3-dehydroquinate dehydratase/shikimate dehydrogenase